jgi:stringent starvation protein B
MGRSEPETTLQRPYLLRAMHEWMTDNNLTPHIVIDVSAAHNGLPIEHAKDGKLVINVSYSATQNLLIGNEVVSCEARFGGVSRHLEVPVLAILGIYARESGQGMVFSSESAAADDETQRPEPSAGDDAPSEKGEPEPGGDKPDKPGGSRPQLRIIK